MNGYDNKVLYVFWLHKHDNWKCVYIAYTLLKTVFSRNGTLAGIMNSTGIKRKQNKHFLPDTSFLAIGINCCTI